MDKRPSLFTILLSGLLAIIFLLAGGILVLRALRDGFPLPGAAEEPAAAVVAATASLVPAATVPLPATDTAMPATATNPPLPVTDTPQPTETPAPSPTPLFYVVQDGDVLFNIALEFGVSLEALRAANNLTGDVITPGQSLLIPQEGTFPATATPSPTEESVAAGPTATPGWPEKVTVGRSYQGFEIPAYVFGNGPADVIFVGGIHGGYEWNTVTLAEEAIQYFTDNPEEVPAGVTLHIIPNANPDGVNLIFNKIAGIQRADLGGNESVEDTIAGRFNGRGVDINRNWECNWSETAFWRDEPVDPGSTFFSEPETNALLSYVRDTVQAEAVIFWHSALGIVAPGMCNADHEPSIQLAQIYAGQTIYSTQPFTAYDVTGDASDYFASIDIPSFSVELTDHFNTERDMNLEGMLAVLQFFAAEETE